MKRFWIVSLVMLMTIVPEFLSAQEKEVPFFDKKGNINIQTTELDALADTIAIVNHRADDVVWSRVVYRVLDMREKQNYQMYFPIRPNDQYRSMFRLMLDAICKGAPVYKRNPRDIKPIFTDSVRLEGEELSKVFAYDNNMDYNLIQINPITKQATVVTDQYNKYVKNQLKFLIQEIVFFDKHTSRMYTKIMAIAPLYALHPDNTQSQQSFKFFQESVLCWFAFDELRPYLTKQYMIPNGNETQRLTYDEFFAQKLYSSYLLGDSNMFNRMLLEYSVDPTKIRKEQQRIETDLLNFEEDLWEY
jgi:gliding motility associated protien GldN